MMKELDSEIQIYLLGISPLLLNSFKNYTREQC